MNKVAQSILAALWVVSFSVVFTAIWLRNPVLWFINIPESVWEVLASALGATCCESIADLEVVVGMFLGMLFAIALWVGTVLSIKLLKILRTNTGIKNKSTS